MLANVNLQSLGTKALFGALYYQFAPQSLHQGALVAQVSGYAMSALTTTALSSYPNKNAVKRAELFSPFVVIGFMTFFQEISWKVYLLSVAILASIQFVIDFFLRTIHNGNFLSGTGSNSEPLWARASNGSVLLNKLPSLRFDDTYVLTQESDGRLHGKREGTSQFSLDIGTAFVYEGVVPGIEFECDALAPLINSRAIARNTLHTSPKGAVSFPKELRASIRLPENAISSCWCYPVLLDPDQAEATIHEIRTNPNIPSFLVGLLLYGGFAFFDESGQLLTVKAFTESETTVQTLLTKNTVSGTLLPEHVRKEFEEGVDLASGLGEWAIYKGGVACQAASKVTIPTLQEHLTHYTFLPSERYASTELETIAPAGAFVFRTKDGRLQVVPLGKVESISHKSELNISEVEACKLRLDLKQILENPRPLFRAFQENLEGLFSLGYQETIHFDDGVYSATENEILIKEGGAQYTITLDDEGKITSVKKSVWAGYFSPNQETTFGATEVPEELTKKLERFYKELMSRCYCYEVSREAYYNTRGRVEFSVTSEGPALVPYNYLRLLSNAIRQNLELSIRIFDLYQRQFIGTDADGLSRTFICALMKGVVRSPYFYLKGANTFFPCNNGALTATDRAFYDQLGTVLAHCFQSGGKFVTGHVFHDSFFPSLQAFNRQELASAILPPLSDERKLELLKVFIGNDKTYLQLFKYLDSDDLSREDETCLEAFLEPYLPDDSEPDIKIVIQDWKNTWKSEVRRRFVEQTEKMGEHNIAALHAIAYRLFATIHMSTGLSLSDRVQGVVNPEVVAASIVSSSYDQTFLKKVGWLKDWIQTTDLENVKQFLEFVGGTRGLPPGQNISVLRSDTKTRYLKSATCFWNLYMTTGTVDEVQVMTDDGERGWHSTYDKFIQSLTDSIKVSGFQNC